MNKLSFKIFLSLLFFVVFFNCERDDICITDVKESPDLIFLMLDKKNTNNRKTPNGFSIRALGTQDILPGIVSDSMALPLKINDNSVQFEFILNFGSDNENIDTLQINYQRFDTFINVGCGFRSNYILESTPGIILNSGNNWIKGFTILKDTITDETNAHLGIIH